MNVNCTTVIPTVRICWDRLVTAAHLETNSEAEPDIADTQGDYARLERAKGLLVVGEPNRSMKAEVI